LDITVLEYIGRVNPSGEILEQKQKKVL